jgi:dihydroorotase
MRRALECSKASGQLIIDHCEDLALSRDGVMNEGRVAAKLGLKGIPASSEEKMVARDIGLARETGGRLHIAHASTRGSVDLIRRARGEGVPVTAEVTPHHLTLTEDAVIGYKTSAKVNPPLRTAGDVEALVAGLREGVIDAVATDHAPHTARDKECDFASAAFGISGFETALGSLMGLVHRGQLDLPVLIARLTTGPAYVLRRADLGSLKPGAPADVVVFDPEKEWVVDPNEFASKGKNTPLAGAKLRGKVTATVAAGVVVYRDSTISLDRVERKT